MIVFSVLMIFRSENPTRFGTSNLIRICVISTAEEKQPFPLILNREVIRKTHFWLRTATALLYENYQKFKLKKFSGLMGLTLIHLILEKII